MICLTTRHAFSGARRWLPGTVVRTAWGVRALPSFQPAAEIDNQEFVWSPAEQRLIIKNLFGRRPFPEDVPAPMYDNFLGQKNVHGLTIYGREYIRSEERRVGK